MPPSHGGDRGSIPLGSTHSHRSPTWASGGPGPKLRKRGETEDGIHLIGGCYRFVDEKGVPLEVLLSYLKEHESMCDWLDFFDDAMKQGWKPKRTFSKLSAAVGDVYGREFRESWEERMIIFRPECKGV